MGRGAGASVAEESEAKLYQRFALPCPVAEFARATAAETETEGTTTEAHRTEADDNSGPGSSDKGGAWAIRRW
jgi:hypothetical protein